MKKLKKILWGLSFITLLGLSPKAHSFFEVNGLYMTDSFDLTAEGAYSTMLLDVAIGFSLDRQKKYGVGWNYSMHSITSELNGVEDSYSSTHMGPRFIWNLGREQSWTWGLTYNLKLEGTHQITGDSEYTLRGASLKTDFTYNIHLGTYSRLGLRFNYLASRYSERLQGETDYETVSQTRTLMYPSASFTYLF